MREISPRLPEFLRRYPAITLHVNLTERQPDILGEDYDVSLQFLTPPGQTMVLRRIRTLHRAICAAPDYLERAGTPLTVEALAAHNCLLYASSAETVEWQFHLHGEKVAVTPHGNLRSTDALTLRDAAVAGLGIVRSPRFIVDEDLQAGRLVRLLPEARSVDPDLCAVFSSRKLVPLKLRVFLDFIQSNFGEPS
jgi:DNA-binding transcriptional LysR family regulator